MRLGIASCVYKFGVMGTLGGGADGSTSLYLRGRWAHAGVNRFASEGVCMGGGGNIIDLPRSCVNGSH